MRIDIEELKGLCEGILMNLGLTKDQASIVFEEYLYAELCGSKGFNRFHGLQNILTHKQGWKIENEGDAFALIDCLGSLGSLVGKYAMDLAVKKAYHSGIAVIGLHNMWPYLMPGFQARAAAEQNMIGIVMDNRKGSTQADGSRRSNPIAVALPSKKPLALQIDTSERVPEHDRRTGKLDPLLHKEADPDIGADDRKSLGSVIEVLAGSLVRAKMGNDIKRAYEGGFIFIVINPGIFVDIKTFQEEIEQHFSGRSMPGQKKQQRYENAVSKGYIDLDEEVAESIMLMVKGNIRD